MQQTTLEPGPKRWEYFAGYAFEIENAIPVTVTKHDDDRVTFSGLESPENFMLHTFVGI